MPIKIFLRNLLTYKVMTVLLGSLIYLSLWFAEIHWFDQMFEQGGVTKRGGIYLGTYFFVFILISLLTGEWINALPLKKKLLLSIFLGMATSICVYFFIWYLTDTARLLSFFRKESFLDAVIFMGYMSLLLGGWLIYPLTLVCSSFLLTALGWTNATSTQPTSTTTQ
jgi:hypothetical protein